MDVIKQADLKSLVESTGPWRISITMPSHRTGEEMKQDPLRLKNLLRQAEERLRELEVRTPDIDRWLEPARALLGNRDFWLHQSDGLAVYLDPKQMRTFRLPLRFEEQVVVSHRYHLKPLFPLLSGDGHFYILALSRNEVRLLEATRDTVGEVKVEGLPKNFAEAVALDDLQKQLQLHNRGGGDRGAQRAGMYHGQGPGQEDTKEQLEKFFRSVDGAVTEYLRDSRAPLVLAGVDYYFPIYRSVSKYSPIAEVGVAGNPDIASPAELQRSAWALLEPKFHEAENAAKALYRRQAGTGKTSHRLDEILPAAFQGRVETLFVATDCHQWGTYDASSNQMQLEMDGKPHQEDLLDTAAIGVFLTGGKVYAMPAAQLPDDSPIAAIFRF